MSDYDRKVKAIQAHNQLLLDAFRAWLEESGLSKKTVRNHVENIDFFTEYLVYYEPLEQLDQATDSDVALFLCDWFPRKAMWASVSSVKSYLASFKKFFKWMGEAGYVSDETVTKVIETLKEEREEFLDAVA